MLVVVVGSVVGIDLHQTHIHDFTSCITAGYDASDSDPQTCTDGHTTYVAQNAAPAKVSADAGTSQDYQILVSGESEGTYPTTQRVITTEADWESYWSAVHASIKPTPPLIPVDFSTQMVIAISMGQRPTTGYGLEFSGFMVGASSATATYESIIPGNTCVTADHATNPYLIIQTAKTSQPVKFVPTSKQSTC